MAERPQVPHYIINRRIDDRLHHHDLVPARTLEGAATDSGVAVPNTAPLEMCTNAEVALRVRTKVEKLSVTRDQITETIDQTDIENNVESMLTNQKVTVEQLAQLAIELRNKNFTDTGIIAAIKAAALDKIKYVLAHLKRQHRTLGEDQCKRLIHDHDYLKKIHLLAKLTVLANLPPDTDSTPST